MRVTGRVAVSTRGSEQLSADCVRETPGSVEVFVRGVCGASADPCTLTRLAWVSELSQ